MYYLSKSPGAREVSITAQPTDPDPYHPHADDAQASLRIELVGQLAAAQLTLEAAIAALDRSGADAAATMELRSKVGSLIGLQQAVGSTNGPALARLRAEVVATANAATSSAEQVQGGVGSAASGTMMTAQQARQAIGEVGHKLFGEHTLDPYLQFASAEDEATYRRREEERRQAYEQELAKHTVEGDRRAAAIAGSQLADAKAHGADRAPEFADLSAKIEAANSALGEPIVAKTVASGKEPAVSDDVSSIAATLRAAGISTPTTTNDDLAHGLTFDKLAVNGRTNEGRG